jgi:hypothetical protein
MKKSLLKGLAVMATLFAVDATAQNRYIEPAFATVKKTSNIMYDSNAAVNLLYGQLPGLQPLFSNKLMCDVYEPNGDVQVKRPLIILAHTGSYLPALVLHWLTNKPPEIEMIVLSFKLLLN